MVQAQLVEDAVEGFWVQVEDGDQGGERRRPGASEPTVTAGRGGQTCVSAVKTGEKRYEQETLKEEEVSPLSPFVVLLFIGARHQGHHDGTVLGRLGDEVLMDLK